MVVFLPSIGCCVRVFAQNSADAARDRRRGDRVAVQEAEISPKKTDSRFEPSRILSGAEWCIAYSASEPGTTPLKVGSDVVTFRARNKHTHLALHRKTSNLQFGRTWIMKLFPATISTALLLVGLAALPYLQQARAQSAAGWIVLFDGKSL